MRRLANYLRYGGSWFMRRYEREILEATARALPAAEGERLLSQLPYFDHLKRLHQDRMVTFYFDLARVGFPYLERDGPELPLAKLSIKSSKRRFSVHVEAHRGRLFSLQFSQSPSHLKQEALVITRVQTLNVSASGVPEAIDREEHADAKRRRQAIRYRSAD